MCTTNSPHFVLQQVLTQSIQKLPAKSAVPIRVIDDFVATISLYGQAQNLQKVLRLLITNAINSPVTQIVVSTKQLLQTDKDVLLEFSVTDEPGKACKNSIQFSPANTAVLQQAEVMIAEMGGKSERINLSGAGIGLKFILKYGWFEPVSTPGSVLPIVELAGKKILLAEDNEINQKWLTQLLIKQGIEVDVAGDGKSAIDMIEKGNAYDLVLMDLQMPHMNGFEAANYIRKKISTTLPIIAVTASICAKEREECLKLGMNEYLTKPFEPKHLIDMLHCFLINNKPAAQPYFNATDTLFR